MGIGVSLFLIAIGAILTFGVTDNSTAIDVAAVGAILMVVGFIGLGLTLAFWSSFSPWADSAPFHRTAAAGGPRYDNNVVEVHERPRPRETVVVRDAPRTVVHEEAPRDRVVIRDSDPGDRV